MTLEDLDFNGVKTYGLVSVNCDGAASQPVTLSNLRFGTTDDPQVALYFHFLQPTELRAFVVKGLMFGPKGIHVQSSHPELLKQVQWPEGVSAIAGDYKPQ